MRRINIHDFSLFPGLRHATISDDSGEDFYHTVLNKEFKEAFEQEEKFVVMLDYVDAYTSSFLDEAFGNLIYDFGLKEVSKLISFISEEEPHWIDMIIKKTFPQWEERRKKKEPPIVTKRHAPWYRLINDNLLLKEREVPA